MRQSHNTVFKAAKASQAAWRFNTMLNEAAKKANCHDCIMQIPEGYDTVAGEDFSARKKIFFLLEECAPSVRMLLNSLQYHNYIVALTQVENIINILIQIYGNLKVFNFSPKKRKLMKLIVFNMLRVLNIFKTLEEGYTEQEEFNARCDKYDRKYLYKIKTNENISECFMTISIMLLQELNNKIGINNPDASVGVCCSHKVVTVGFNALCYDAERRGIKPSVRIKKTVLNTLKYICGEESFYSSIMDSLIEVNSFKESFSIDYFMNKEVLTSKDYKKIVKAIFK